MINHVLPKINYNYWESKKESTWIRYIRPPNNPSNSQSPTIKVDSYKHSLQLKSQWIIFNAIIATYNTYTQTVKPCDPIPQMGLSKLFLFFFFLIPFRSYAAENVPVTLYYETLCPYCADFIVNHLAKIFQNGLISIVNLRMVPWGNAWLNSDGSFACQVTILYPQLYPFSSSCSSH